jgi:hypothetical protein
MKENRLQPQKHYNPNILLHEKVFGFKQLHLIKYFKSTDKGCHAEY